MSLRARREGSGGGGGGGGPGERQNPNNQGGGNNNHGRNDYHGDRNNNYNQNDRNNNYNQNDRNNRRDGNNNQDYGHQRDQRENRRKRSVGDVHASDSELHKKKSKIPPVFDAGLLEHVKNHLRDSSETLACVAKNARHLEDKFDCRSKEHIKNSLKETSDTVASVAESIRVLQHRFDTVVFHHQLNPNVNPQSPKQEDLGALPDKPPQTEAEFVRFLPDNEYEFDRFLEFWINNLNKCCEPVFNGAVEYVQKVLLDQKIPKTTIYYPDYITATFQAVLGHKMNLVEKQLDEKAKQWGRNRI
jgi:hypothetical protein